MSSMLKHYLTTLDTLDHLRISPSPLLTRLRHARLVGELDVILTTLEKMTVPTAITPSQAPAELCMSFVQTSHAC